MYKYSLGKIYLFWWWADTQIIVKTEMLYVYKTLSVFLSVCLFYSIPSLSHSGSNRVKEHLYVDPKFCAETIISAYVERLPSYKKSIFWQ
jgi:hypothetical protein